MVSVLAAAVRLLLCCCCAADDAYRDDIQQEPAFNVFLSDKSVVADELAGRRVVADVGHGEEELEDDVDDKDQINQAIDQP